MCKMFYDEILINRDINICFFNGKIVAEPEFGFFYNSKKYNSKVHTWLKTEDGFTTFKQRESVLVKLVAYNDIQMIYTKILI